MCFKSSHHEIPLLSKVKCLQDAYNNILSNFANQMEEDIHTTILVIKNYDGEDLGTFRRNLATYGAIKVRSYEGAEGGVDTLEISVNAENYKTLLALLKDAIIENARGYDAKDDRMSGDPNQMNIQSMYSDIDLDANGMHSVPATNLENLNLLTALKYTDKDGITRDLTLYTWNGKLVLVDDGMPVEAVDATYKQTSDTALVTGKTYYTKSGTKYTAVVSPSVDNIATYYEVDVPAGEEYTSYVLGEGSINFEDLGAKVPYEMSRDPAKNGGQDTLYTRQRKVFAPKGISYEKANQTSLSPTDAELSNGANWALVHSGEATESQRSYINHKVIPIARIKSRG